MRRPRTRTAAALALMVFLIAPPSPALADQGPSLDQLLSLAGNSVTSFLDKLGDVTCNEEVSQEKLGDHGKSQERVQSAFEYLLLAQTQNNEPMLYEARQPVHEGQSRKNLSLLVTNGFATELLVFHPYYQPSFQFQKLPDTVVHGKSYAQVHFQYVKGRPSPSAMLLRGREYPLALAGVATIDPATGTIEHITSDLGASMEDLGLKTFHSSVDYALTSFPSQNKSYWLPVQAIIEVSTPRQHWKNVHRFTGCHLFSVTTTEQVNLDKLKSKDQ